MKTVDLGEDLIVLELREEEPDGSYLAGAIVRPFPREGAEDEDEDSVCNAALDAVESVILAHACAGVDVQTPAYKAGIRTAIETIGNYISGKLPPYSISFRCALKMSEKLFRSS